MARFQATIESTATISASRQQVWNVLTDPQVLPELTPLLTGIDADGDLWRWHLTRIAALGVSVTPSFTERMHFDELRRIEFTHDAPRARTERAGAEGWYELSDADGGSSLAISLTLCVELPLPRTSAPVVERVMRSIMRRTGDRFSRNLLNRLGAHQLSAA